MLFEAKNSNFTTSRPQLIQTSISMTKNSDNTSKDASLERKVMKFEKNKIKTFNIYSSVSSVEKSRSRDKKKPRISRKPRANVLQKNQTILDQYFPKKKSNQKSPKQNSMKVKQKQPKISQYFSKSSVKKEE